MEKERLSKKQITSLVIGILTLVVLITSATYAFFSVTVGNSSGTTTITGDIGGGTLGTVTLNGGNTELYLGVSAYDMSETNKGKTYYSSTTEGSRETSVANAGKTTYTATLSGDDSDSVMYACDYEFTVTSAGDALGKESINDIELVFNGDINKTINLTGTDKVSGTWFGFKNSNKERVFNTYLQLTNTDSNQNSLAGTNLSVSISNTKWKCYLSELDELVGEAYALLTMNSNDSDYYDLTFVRSETSYSVGDIYNGVEIKEIYTEFENGDSIPWHSQSENIIRVSFEDEIRPISTVWWFANFGSDSLYIDVTNLNTSLVTDMSGMFSINSITNNIVFVGLSKLDVSNVTNMDGMFIYIGYDASNVVIEGFDLSGWDVSNVENMSNMFAGLAFSATEKLPIVGVKNWNTSNVTNMEGMFEEANVDFEVLDSWDVSNVENMSRMFKGSNLAYIDLSEWNVAKVKDMSYMFDGAILNENNIDLSGWDTLNVTDYVHFNADVYGEGNLILPVWKNLYFGVYSEDDYSLRIYNDLNIPQESENYKERTATKVFNMSYEDSLDFVCHNTVVPTKIIVEDNISPLDTYGWFDGCTKVNTIDVSKLDTSNVTVMSQMFYNVGNDASVTSMTITGIDSWDTSNVTSMAYMFYNFGKNATYILDLSSWDVSNVPQDGYQHFNYGVTNKVIAPSWKVN